MVSASHLALFRCDARRLRELAAPRFGKRRRITGAEPIKRENIAAAGAIFSIGSDFLCNAAQSFGKKWETVYVRTKTKTMKAIET